MAQVGCIESIVALTCRNDRALSLKIFLILFLTSGVAAVELFQDNSFESGAPWTLVPDGDPAGYITNNNNVLSPYQGSKYFLQPAIGSSFIGQTLTIPSGGTATISFYGKASFDGGANSNTHFGVYVDNGNVQVERFFDIGPDYRLYTADLSAYCDGTSHTFLLYATSYSFTQDMAIDLASLSYTPPLTTKPLTTKPLTTKLLTTQPLTTKPLTTKPLTTRALTTKQLTTQALTTKPLTTRALTTKPRRCRSLRSL
eukprot:TRINITY_DN4007_c0_g1_i1.p1 TRINITY_DN4007_c0_g1~~TRINITY_DN4007_c0_g1_i1.p1  ORF type:complete len:281 (+),score=7.84 TRINITY_DN4007_c0_g1_i1:76-843(+)